MATARKKQEDAENLKTLRELVSLPHNKHCFDCNQRGPTYVNVTIGSFVCTKCSGMLRGLTPPHRVKSISMATFTAEEIALLQNRGNDYCRRTWLGLYEGSPLTEGGRDEQQIHDLMIDKYERRRYYLEAPVTRTNGALPPTKPLNHLVHEPKALRLNGVNSDAKNDTVRNLLSNSKTTTSAGGGGKTSSGAITTTTTNFVANFDIFNTVNNNTQPSFANFDNNPVFNNTKDRFSIFDLQFSPCGPMLNQVPLFPKCSLTRWNPFLLANGLEEDLMNDWINFDSGGSFLDYSNTSMPTTTQTSTTTTSNNLSNLNHQQKNNANVPPAPPEDRYAALKDLDNALKNQSALDWNSGGSSSGSLYSSSTPAGSMYSSPSPQSMYGSPSQGHFGSVFTSSQDSTSTSNPFNHSGTTSSMWGGNGVSNGSSNSNQNQNQNPFRASDSFKTNGFSHHDFFPAQVNGVAWTPNPFKIGSSNGHSSNPFL